MMPALFSRWTALASRTETTLIAVSRHFGKLALIRPWDLSGKGTPAEARRLHDLLEEEVYAIASAYTLPRLAREIPDVANEADAKSWASKAFISWQKRHTVLVDRPQNCRLSSAATMDILQGSQIDIVNTVAVPASSASAAEEEKEHLSLIHI